MTAGYSSRRTASSGFTLIELMIAVAIVGILAGITLPSFAEFVRRARVPTGLMELSTFHMRMEQRFQDRYSYLDGATCVVAPPKIKNFNITCVASADGNSFEAQAVGTGQLTGYRYAINQNGSRLTLAHPRGVPPGSCWSVKGAVCDI